MEVIILKIVQYKEKDAIVTAFNDEQCISFLAKRILDPKNINASIATPLVVVDISLNEDKNYKHSLLKSSKVLLTPMKTNASLFYLSSLMLINEMVLKLLLEEDYSLLYHDLLEGLKLIKSSDDNIYFVLLSLLSKILKINGFDMEVNKCINCSNKNNIVSFSFDDGGFLCSDCYQGTKIFTKNELMYIRYLFLNKGMEIIPLKLDKEKYKHLLSKYFDFIESSLDVKLKSKDIFFLE